MPVFKLTIEYNGTPFSGWQIQDGQRTVQGDLIKALETVLRSPHSLQGASRTDAGVHARGQAASFLTDVEIEPQRLVRGLSALCAPDIAVTSAVQVHDDFNARFDSKGKHYCYTLLNRSAPSPLHRNTTWHVPASLNLDVMNAAAAALVGEHDFAGFRAADCGRDNTVRTITSVDIVPGNGDLIEIHVRGTAFLKNMVRILAGTLVDMGRGALPPDTVQQVFATGDRTKAGKTAPACGLTLMEVYF